METERQGQRAATRGTPRDGRDSVFPPARIGPLRTKPPRARSARSCVGAKMGSSKGKQLTAQNVSTRNVSVDITAIYRRGLEFLRGKRYGL